MFFRFLKRGAEVIGEKAGGRPPKGNAGLGIQTCVRRTEKEKAP
jgi:hypothetical protein